MYYIMYVMSAACEARPRNLGQLIAIWIIYGLHILLCVLLYITNTIYIYVSLSLSIYIYIYVLLYITITIYIYIYILLWIIYGLHNYMDYIWTILTAMCNIDGTRLFKKANSHTCEFGTWKERQSRVVNKIGPPLVCRLDAQTGYQTARRHYVQK